MNPKLLAELKAAQRAIDAKYTVKMPEAEAPRVTHTFRFPKGPWWAWRARVVVFGGDGVDGNPEIINGDGLPVWVRYDRGNADALAAQLTGKQLRRYINAEGRWDHPTPAGAMYPESVVGIVQGVVNVTERGIVADLAIFDGAHHDALAALEDRGVLDTAGLSVVALAHGGEITPHREGLLHRPTSWSVAAVDFVHTPRRPGARVLRYLGEGLEG